MEGRRARGAEEIEAREAEGRISWQWSGAPAPENKQFWTRASGCELDEGSFVGKRGEGAEGREARERREERRGGGGKRGEGGRASARANISSCVRSCAWSILGPPHCIYRTCQCQCPRTVIIMYVDKDNGIDNMVTHE